MKVFLSHAMSGLDESTVMEIRKNAIELLTEKYGEIEVIDNYHHENAPENAGRIWHLGTSISQMEEADAIYFCDNATSKGCLIEMMIATLYHLRILNYEFGSMIQPKDITNTYINGDDSLYPSILIDSLSSTEEYHEHLEKCINERIQTNACQDFSLSEYKL